MRREGRVATISYLVSDGRPNGAIPTAFGTRFRISRSRFDMPIEPIDLTALISSVLGISIVLIPIIGLTARFALKPTVEALARVFETKGTGEAIQILERRLSLLESQIENLESGQHRLEEAARFDAQLKDGPPKPSLPGPTAAR